MSSIFYYPQGYPLKVGCGTLTLFYKRVKMGTSGAKWEIVGIYNHGKKRGIARNEYPNRKSSIKNANRGN